MKKRGLETPMSQKRRWPGKKPTPDRLKPVLLVNRSQIHRHRRFDANPIQRVRVERNRLRLRGRRNRHNSKGVRRRRPRATPRRQIENRNGPGRRSIYRQPHQKSGRSLHGSRSSPCNVRKLANLRHPRRRRLSLPIANGTIGPGARRIERVDRIPFDHAMIVHSQRLGQPAIHGVSLPVRNHARVIPLRLNRRAAHQLGADNR
jgi:hypothetical protein